MTARGLLLASHPAPVLTVTVLVFALVMAVGAPAGVAGGAGLAVLAGQLSVGWSNDAADAADDIAAARAAKPVVRGMVEVGSLWVAAWLALAAAVAASFAFMGAVPGGLHVLAVLAAWAYNVRVKDTPFSPLPYAVAFGLLPVIVSDLAQPPVETAASWAVICGCIGVAAHLANTAPDIDSDRAVGRGGLAVVLGSGPTRVLAVAFAGVATAVALVSLASPSPVLAAWALGCVAVLGVVAAISHGRWLFAAVMAAAVTNAVLLWALA